jgi:hypothetical protein
MLNSERSASSAAVTTGVYTVFRCSLPNPSLSNSLDFCSRVGPSSMCFCGHLYSDHLQSKKTLGNTKCSRCPSSNTFCHNYEFMFTRPEEVGDSFLPRRRGFNVHTWKPKCRCGHTHVDHANKVKRCDVKGCSCNAWESHFLCMNCDRHWEDHETVWETESERRQKGYAVGEAFIPLAGMGSLQEEIFGLGGGDGGGGAAARGGSGRTVEQQFEAGEITAQQYMERLQDEDTSEEDAGGGGNVGMKVRKEVISGGQLAPKHSFRKPDRSIQLSHESSGGMRKGKVLNRYGKAEEE